MSDDTTQDQAVRASSRRLAFLGVLSGIAMATGQAPLSLWYVAVLGLLAVFWFSKDVRSWKQAAVYGWLVGSSYFAASMYWIIEPFFVDAARHGWMAPFALVFLAGGLALLWGGAFALAYRLRPSAWHWSLALLWGGMELVRGYLFTGFPWGMFGYIWIDTPLAQVAALIGPYGLTLASFLLAAGIVSSGDRGMRPSRVISVLAAIGLLWFGVQHEKTEPVANADAPIIRLVQTNAQQDQKWLPDMIPVFWQRNLTLTAERDLDGKSPDVIVWPETAIPYLFHGESTVPEIISDAAQGEVVIAGGQRRSPEGFHNSMMVIGPDGAVQDIYDKHHLVPFGEYIPGGSLLGRFGLSGLAQQIGSGYAPGAGPEILSLGRSGAVLPLICYEAVFPRDLRVNGQRADWILHITNDAWFGDFAGPYQHLVQARFRAIEQGLPVARAANTGITAMIGPTGDVVQSISLGVSGAIDVALPEPLKPTPYSRFGEIPVLVLLLAGLLGVFWFKRREKSH